MKNKERNYYIDATRILLMLMVTIHHSIVHGFNFSEIQNKNSNINGMDLFLLNAVCIIGVNLFFFISGYFGINYKKEKLIDLLKEYFTYFFIISIAVQTAGYRIPASEFIQYLIFPFNMYWFMGAYLGVVLLSPFLNKMIDSLTSKEIKTLVIILFIINFVLGFLFSTGSIGNGYTLAQGIYIYILAGGLRKLKETTKYLKVLETISIIPTKCNLLNL